MFGSADRRRTRCTLADWAQTTYRLSQADGRWFRTLTVLDVFTRESQAPVADRSLTGVKVAAALTPSCGAAARPRRS